MFTKILVAADGSEHADKAVEVASDLAQKYHAELIVLHVRLHGRPLEEIRKMAEVEHMIEITPPPPPPTGLSGTGAAMADDSRIFQSLYRVIEAVGNRIVEQAERVARDKGVEAVRTIVEDGDTAQRILTCAKRENADLIVMGSRGLGELAGMFLGSNSHKVSQLAECTCITVK